MRGIIVVITTVFVAAAVLLVGAPVLEDIGDVASSDEDVKDAGLAGTVDKIIQSTIQWSILALMGGIGVWAIAYYVRRERTVRRRP